jgi:hypothetical protein
VQGCIVASLIVGDGGVLRLDGRSPTILRSLALEPGVFEALSFLQYPIRSCSQDNDDDDSFVTQHLPPSSRVAACLTTSPL